MGIILTRMSEVLIPLPESLLNRLERLIAPTGRDVGEVLSRVIADSMPTVPDGLPEDIRLELEALESLRDEELREIALSFIPADRLPKYSSGGEADRAMLRKAYANVILKWRGSPVSEELLNVACQPT